MAEVMPVVVEQLYVVESSHVLDVQQQTFAARLYPVPINQVLWTIVPKVKRGTDQAQVDFNVKTCGNGFVDMLV